MPGTSWIDFERITVSAIIEGIESDHDSVVVPETRIAQHDIRHDLFGIRVVTANTKVDELSIRQDAYIGTLGRLSSRHRRHLQEGVNECSILPYGVTQLTVDLRSFLTPSDTNAGASLFRTQ